MMTSLRVSLVALLLVSSTASPGAEFDALLAKVPNTANVLMMIDVQNTLEAPIAKEKGWSKKLELAYVNRPVFLPPEANKMVMAANLDASNDFRRNYEMAVMEMSESMPMRMIARSEGGYVEEMGGTEVAWTPSDVYFVSLADKQLGVVYPANRQYVSRWIDAAKTKSSVTLSGYLSKAAAMTNDRIQVLLAMDLSNLLEPHEVTDHVDQSALFKQAKVATEEATEILTSLQGAMLRLAIGEEVLAELRIDFGKDVTPLSSIAKQVVVNVVGELGIDIAEMSDWKETVEGSTIKLSGKLSEDGQRRVFSVVELPSAKFSLLKDEAEADTTTNESKIRESSLVYFRSINTLFRDLKRDLQGNKASAAVMERYARKIDRMPILNVDPALLDYGSDVAETLRMVALSKRQGGIQSGVATAGMGGRGYSDYSYNYGYRGADRYSGARQSAADRSAYKAQALAASKNARLEGAKQISDSTAAIRRAMTQKYEVEF